MSRAGLLALLALSGLLGGCGYSTGFTLPESKSVGVAVFANDSKQRDVERDLHTYVSDAVERLVNSPLVSPASADYVIDGKIVDYSHRGGIRSTDNVLLETGVRVVVVARLVRRSGGAPRATEAPEDVLRQVTVSDERGYVIEDPLGESDALALVLRNIADRLVLDLFADQAYSEAP